MKHRISPIHRGALPVLALMVAACTGGNETDSTNEPLGTSSSSATGSVTASGSMPSASSPATNTTTSPSNTTTAPAPATSSAPLGSETASASTNSPPTGTPSASENETGGTGDVGAPPVMSSDAVGGAGDPGPAASNSAGADNLGGAGNAPQEAGAPVGECTRELLKSTTDAYFEAMAAHDPSTLPLAADVKFTENGEESELGAEGLWPMAGEVKHTHSALDTEECQAVTQAVVPEGSMDIPLGLRIKLVAGEISEIETIAVRPGDYKVSGQNFDSDTDAIISSAEDVGWEMVVPEAQRATREELIAWMNKYYRLFPAGVCNVTDDCRRRENGGGNFDCDLGASCAADEPGPDDEALSPRLILADVETGIGVGFTMFQENTDMHMFKMYDGQVHGVQAILGAADGSGWD